MTSFFEPLPPPPDPAAGRRQWAPPVWDRPSEGTVPWLVPVNAVVHRGDLAVVCVESLSVYPNGFVVDLRVLTDPRRSYEEVMAGVRRSGAQVPRVGVRFSDGRTAGREATWPHGPARPGLPKEDDGVPTVPVVRFVGGGGGVRAGWRFGVWVHPLPPKGPVEIFVSLPAAGLEEGRAVVDGKAVRSAAKHASVVWT